MLVIHIHSSIGMNLVYLKDMAPLFGLHGLAGGNAYQAPAHVGQKSFAPIDNCSRAAHCTEFCNNKVVISS